MDGERQDGATWRGEIEREFVAEVESGRLDLPLPGTGRTRRRWEALSALARRDLSLARLCEGHTDAVAILAELGGPAPPTGSRWGVWAAQPPGPALLARPEAGGWRLFGTKRYCSGARVCTHALVTAETADGPRLFAVSAVPGAGLRPVDGSWPATGMAASDTLDVRFDEVLGVPAEPVGPVDGYVRRPGFHQGGAGVAACWYGGARGVAETLLAAAAERDVGPHALAHLGAVDVALRTARAALEEAADEIDADPHDLKNAGRARSLRLKALVEAVATDVMGRVGRALGAGPLGHDAAHGRRVADLTVYLRQHHAERDLAALGALVAEQGAGW
ncbi:acyl-CoA dehydrogenase family protein [Streptosporangium oxazolinicum]|uniref:Acyl-CoA dehydrogenase family protein n=1 Tax=Streptosporangium oxazolinicum TaxID=909287 RepID=A0ABP8BDP2_9ACTN